MDTVKDLPITSPLLISISKSSKSHLIKYSITSSNPSWTIWCNSFDALMAAPGPP